MTMNETHVLIVEDGDEYLENLSRFVPGPSYTQVHTGAQALRRLEDGPVDVVYLDMRFDRIAREELLGDHATVTRECNGDPERAWKYLQNNQGLYILDGFRKGGFGDVPIVLAYDFSREKRRFEHLRRLSRNLHWVSDSVTPEEIRELFERLRARSS